MSKAKSTQVRNNIIHPKIRASKLFRGIVATLATIIVWPVTLGASLLVESIAGISIPWYVSLVMAAPVGVLYLAIGSED